MHAHLLAQFVDHKLLFLLEAVLQLHLLAIELCQRRSTSNQSVTAPTATGQYKHQQAVAKVHREACCKCPS